MWRAYQYRVLCSYALWHVAPPSVPHITLVVRQRTGEKQVRHRTADKSTTAPQYRMPIIRV